VVQQEVVITVADREEADREEVVVEEAVFNSIIQILR
jgi:hypothetical protein